MGKLASDKVTLQKGLTYWNFIQCYYALKGKFRELGDKSKELISQKKSQNINEVLKLIYEDSEERLIDAYYSKSNEVLEKVRGNFKDDRSFLKILRSVNEDLKWLIKHPKV